VFTNELPYQGYDQLVVTITLAGSSYPLLETIVDNTSPRGVWTSTRVALSSQIIGYRGEQLEVRITAVTDDVNLTGWNVDQVFLKSACGAFLP